MTCADNLIVFLEVNYVFFHVLINKILIWGELEVCTVYGILYVFER